MIRYGFWLSSCQASCSFHTCTRLIGFSYFLSSGNIAFICIQDDPAKPARDFHLSAQQSASLSATKLLYEQRGSFSPIFQLNSAPSEPLHMFRQRVAAAPSPAPDEFDDDDFLSEPADIPVDPNSEARRHKHTSPQCGAVEQPAAARF